MVGLVEENGGAGDEIEDGVASAGDRSVELPAGENIDAACPDGGFDDFFRAFDTFAAETGVNRTEQVFADGSFGEREEQGLIDRIR